MVVPLDAGWSDIGAWAALWAVSEQDDAGNACHGDVMVHEARNNLLHAHHRILAAVGVTDLIVVETSDAVLVAHKDHAQDVKKITEQLDAQGRCEGEFHRRVHRPWGRSRVSMSASASRSSASASSPVRPCRCRCIITGPSTGSWSAVRRESPATTGSSCSPRTSRPISRSVPATGWKIRARFHSKSSRCSPAPYLGEDDIVRFEDVYNRAGKTD